MNSSQKRVGWLIYQRRRFCSSIWKNKRIFLNFFYLDVKVFKYERGFYLSKGVPLPYHILPMFCHIRVFSRYCSNFVLNWLKTMQPNRRCLKCLNYFISCSYFAKCVFFLNRYCYNFIFFSMNWLQNNATKSIAVISVFLSKRGGKKICCCCCWLKG